LARTGVFFHYQQGSRLKDFPQALGDLLSHPQVLLYDALYPGKPKASYELEPVPPDLLRAVHSESMIEQVKRTPYYDTALYSAGGTVQASQEIWEGRIDNAFVFTGSGDHHAGADFFGGWCYFNGAALAIHKLRTEYQGTRFAIVDTDAHHGDGTWDIYKDDEDVLYLCLCSSAGSWDEKGNVNISVRDTLSDDEYLARVEEEAVPRIRDFGPELIFWNWGYDGTTGDYGDMGLTPDCHVRLARVFRRGADEVCRGRLIVVLCGGHARETATYAIPRIIRCLAED
jgi:acetoin utilization deacetylase AcuC-like enzyme